MGAFAITSGHGIHFRKKQVGNFGTSWQLSLWLLAITYVPIKLSDLLRVYANSIEEEG